MRTDGLTIWLSCVICYGAGRMSSAYFQDSFVDAGIMTGVFATVFLLIMLLTDMLQGRRN